MLIMSSKVWFRSSLTFLIFIFSVSRSSSTWKSINNQSINRQLMSRSFSTWALNMIVILRLSKDSSDHLIIRSSDVNVLNHLLQIKGSYDNMSCIIWSNQLIIWSEVTFEWRNHNDQQMPPGRSWHSASECSSQHSLPWWQIWMEGPTFLLSGVKKFGRGIKTLTSQCLPSLQSWPLLTSNLLPSLQLWPLFTFHFQTCSRWLSASEATPGSQTANTDDQVLMIRPYIRYKMIEMLRWWIIIDGANKKKDVLGRICFCFLHETYVRCEICSQL